MSTSVSYLKKRLADIGRHDLLQAAEAGLVSHFAAAEEAGLITRREVLGTGSANQARKRAYALMRITGKSPLRPLKPEPKPESEISPAPAHPKFSQTRDIIARLVDLGRADLVVAIVERRLSPFAAARIARGRRRAVSDHDRPNETPNEISNETSPGSGEIPMPVDRIDKVEKVEQAPKPKKPALDVRALIG